VYNAGVDIALTETSPGSKTYKTVDGTGAPVPILPDDDYDVIMRITVPAPAAGAVDNSQNVITITTKSDFDNTKTATGTYTTTVSASAITAVKIRLCRTREPYCRTRGHYHLYHSADKYGVITS